jgi:dGTPase
MIWENLLSSSRDIAKPVAGGQDRSAFEQDYDRIVFSHPFRSLQDKTQVFPLATNDFVHTRLTHSLEVASVGRSLGRKAGEIICSRHTGLTAAGLYPFDFGTIVSAASLLHDIGNPPFGHAGENAMSGYFSDSDLGHMLQQVLPEKQFSDLCNFEGNAQGFRLANKNSYQGLKLTFATLGAFSKYPRESLVRHKDEARKSQKKYGFYQSNKQSFADVAHACGLRQLGSDGEAIWCRHPLAFLVEAADDICYNIIDLEDGTNLGLVDFAETVELLAAIIGDRLDKQKLETYKSTDEKTGLLRALVIRELITQCVRCFADNEEEILAGTFDRALTDTIPSSKALNTIGKVSYNKIYKSKPVLEREVAGFEVLSGLLGAFAPAAYEFAQKGGTISWHQSSLFALLPEETRLDIRNAGHDIYEVMLLLLDFISGLTDSRALALYRNIKGISVPGVG